MENDNMSTTSYSNDKLDTFSMPSIADINKFREKQMVISLKLRMIQNGFNPECDFCYIPNTIKIKECPSWLKQSPLLTDKCVFIKL